MYVEKKEPYVAILLATYNGEKYIRQQMLTILSQTFSNFCLYVRDDGSNDNTLAIIEEMLVSDERVVLLKDQYAGPTGVAGRNFFRMLEIVELDAFDYVAFADQDDIWNPEKIERGVSFIQDGYDGYSADLISFHESHAKPSYINKKAVQTKYDYLFQGASAGCTYMISKKSAIEISKIYSKCGKDLQKIISHDWIIYAVVRSRGWQWYHDRYPAVFYRQHSVNVQGAQTGLRGIFYRMKLIGAGWYISHVLTLEKFALNSPGEIEIFEKVRKLDLVSRLWLLRRSLWFRRSKLDVLALSFCICFLFRRQFEPRR